MPSSQNLALKFKANFWDEGNSRWRYIYNIPYKPFKIFSCSSSLELTQNQRDLSGAVSNFHPLYFGWELYMRGNHHGYSYIINDAFCSESEIVNLYFVSVNNNKLSSFIFWLGIINESNIWQGPYFKDALFENGAIP